MNFAEKLNDFSLSVLFPEVKNKIELYFTDFC